MLFFCSDLHLGHANIIRLCRRPFADVEEMDACLIANWNERVTDSDRVYLLGDLMFRNRVAPEDYLRRLKGKKHLIIGNHDREWMKAVELGRHFETVSRLELIATGDGLATLCHYPMMSFEGKYLIYGHIHNNRKDAYWPLLRGMERALNASVEVNDYRPATLEELIAHNRAFRAAEDLPGAIAR